MRELRYMPKRRIRIHSKEAVDLIRSGASDALVMETFGLSAVGLRKLFEKLVDSQEIQQSELDCRVLSSCQSNTVDLTRVLMDFSQPGTVNIDAAVKDINAGISDSALMEKYRLSVNGLENLFQKLVAAGEITESQLDGRNRLARETGIDFPEPVWVDYAPSEGYQPGNREKGGFFSGLFRNYHLVLAATAAGIVGASVVAAVFLIVFGFDRVEAPLRPSHKPNRGEEAARSNADRQVQEATTILESIAADRQDASKSRGDGAIYLQECLRNCENFVTENDNHARTNLANCKKECLDMHSELFKRMRGKYHDRPE